MKAQKIFIGCVVALLLTVVSALFVQSALLADQSPSRDLHKKIIGLAAEGDPIAQEKLRRLWEFLETGGSSFDQLVRSGRSNSRVVNGALVSAKGIRPFYLKIYNEAQLTDPQLLGNYIEERKLALEALVEVNSDRILEVAISPSEPVRLDQFWQMKEKYGLEVDELSLDLTINGKWDSMIWVAKENGMANPVNLSGSIGQVRQQLWGLLASVPLPPSEDGQRRAEKLKMAELTLRFARGRVRGQEASLLQGEESILLVDPITDLRDSFSNEAVEVEVVAMPHLYVLLNSAFSWPKGTDDASDVPSLPKKIESPQRGKVPSDTPSKLVLGPDLQAYRLARNDGWKSNDFGEDNPDNEWWIFAPNSWTHDMWWYDYDTYEYCDWILDWQMKWWEGNSSLVSAPVWFMYNPQYKVCHEIRADHRVYEAHSFIWTDLPAVTHNEDSSWYEEIYDGYEEKEVGIDQPWQIDSNHRYELWTAWAPLNDGNSFFESESELTRPNPWTGNPWYPYWWDQLGKLWAWGAY